MIGMSVVNLIYDEDLPIQQAGPQFIYSYFRQIICVKRCPQFVVFDFQIVNEDTKYVELYSTGETPRAEM